MDIPSCSPQNTNPPPNYFGCGCDGHKQEQNNGLEMAIGFQQCISTHYPCDCHCDTTQGNIKELTAEEAQYAHDHNGAVEKVYQEGAYKITILPATCSSGLTQVTIYDACTGQTTSITGDPDVNNSNHQYFNFKNNIDFVLKDGTHVQIDTEDHADRHQIGTVQIENNYGLATVQHANYAYNGGTSADVTSSLVSSGFTYTPAAHAIYQLANGDWGFTPASTAFTTDQFKDKNY